MSAIDLVTAAFSSSSRSEKHGRGELLTLPIGLSNGNLVQIYIEQLADDRWLVSDSGQAAFELAVAGVNLETNKAASRSWDHLVRSLRLEPVLLHETGQYDLAGVADTGSLGAAVLALSEAVVRGDGLKALAPSFRARRFRDVIVQAAGKRELPVLLDAHMPTRHGGSRQVSLAVEGNHRVFMQAVSGRGSQIEGFDKAQAVFSSAEVPRDSLVAVLASRVQLQPWQWETLRERGIPLKEEDLDDYMAKLAS